jgi:hypothetical protein
VDLQWMTSQNDSLGDDPCRIRGQRGSHGNQARNCFVSRRSSEIVTHPLLHPHPGAGCTATFQSKRVQRSSRPWLHLLSKTSPICARCSHLYLRHGRVVRK